MEEPALLEVRNVSRHFAGVVANDDVSITCRRGEMLGLIGPNGAGKSTLFNLIAGALPTSAGRILFEGEDVTQLTPATRCARGIARTFQVVRSFDSMSVLDNVVVGALIRTANTREARLKAHAMLEFTGLDHRSGTLANELTPPDKRRLEVARALATGPKLLLLDEVLTGLTPAEAKGGMALVRQIRDMGITVLMVEHVMEIVMPLVDRAVVLDLGRVLFEGKPSAAAHDARVIAAYLGVRHLASSH